MKSKTHFKQMYLVDPIAYNRINNTTTSNPIIIGKPNIQISPPNSNVSAPVITEIPIQSTLILVLKHLLELRVMYYIQNPWEI